MIGNRKISLIGTVVVGYFILSYISLQLANYLLAIFLILLIPVLLFRQLFLDATYKNSITLVDKKFVFDRYTLHNEHCMIKYTPDEKLVVIENIGNSKREKRMFTISKKNKVNVNKCWNMVCKVFDGFVGVDSLVSFFSYDTTVDVKLIPYKGAAETEPAPKQINIDTSNSGPKFVDIQNVRPDTYAEGTEHQRAYKENFVNMENIKEADKVKEREIKAHEFVEMGEVLSSGSKQIDVNSVEASELSLLPGINIVLAKKIIEYRNTNGLFKSVDDFLKVANVKEHFIPKIKSMIIIGKPKTQNDNNDEDLGRIIDF